MWLIDKYFKITGDTLEGQAQQIHVPCRDNQFVFKENIENYYGMKHQLLIYVCEGYHRQQLFRAIQLYGENIKTILTLDPTLENVEYCIGGYVVDDYTAICSLQVKDMKLLVRAKLSLSNLD